MNEKAENGKNDYNKLVPAVEQAIKIITYLSSMPNLQSNLTDIANNVGISKSKAYAILNTLQTSGFVYRNPDTKIYSLGLYIMSIGQKVMDNISYRELSGPFLLELAAATRSSAFMGIIAGNNQFVIARQEMPEYLNISVRSDRVYPLTYGAHGKAIVAFLPENERNNILSEKSLYFHRDPQLLDRNLLMKELEECKMKGFAQDKRTGHSIVKIIAAPFFGLNSKPLGAIQIIGLIEDKDVSAQGAKVVEAAQRFSMLLSNGMQGSVIG